MTHHHIQQTPEADRCRGVDRSLLEFLKPKAEERYSKLEAYCDLLSKASSGAYQSPGTDGALQVDREDEPTEQREPSSSLEWPSREGGRRSQLLEYGSTES